MTRGALTLSILVLLAGCSSPQVPLLEDVSAAVVNQLEKELGATRPLVRLRDVAVSGPLALPGDADRARSALEEALAASATIRLLRPPAGTAGPSCDLDVSIEPSPVRREGERILEDGARVDVSLHGEGPALTLPLRVRRKFEGGWRTTSVARGP